MRSEGVARGAHPSWGHRWVPPSSALTGLQGQGHHCHPRPPPGWSSEEVDWNYLVQWFFTRTSQLQFICHCSLPSQGAPGTGKQIRRGNSILLRTLSPSKTAQCTKGVLRGSRDGRKERREMDCQGGQLGVECVSEKHLQVNVVERAWNVGTRLPGTRHLPAM